jgi:hypothetical protein
MIIRSASAVLAAAFVTGAAQAGELRPMQANSIVLGEAKGVAYYVATDEGFQVVTTIAAGEDATPMRFEATLKAGQRVVLSVPRGVGEEQVAVEIARFGDTVVVSEPVAEISTVLN